VRSVNDVNPGNDAQAATITIDAAQPPGPPGPPSPPPPPSSAASGSSSGGGGGGPIEWPLALTLALLWLMRVRSRYAS